MVQALLNTFNTPTVTSAKNPMSDCNAQKTDFQKLFDKQHAVQEEKTSFSQDIQQSSAISETIQTDQETKTDADSETNTEDLTQQAATAEVPLLAGIIQNIVSEVVPQKESDITSNEETENTNTAQNIETDFDINLNDLNINNQVKTETAATIQIKTKDAENTESKSIEEIVDEEILKELNIESIESETANDESSSDLMQNQTPQEQGVRAMINADTEFTEIKPEIKPAEVSQGQQASLSAKTSPDKIVEQISKHMEKLYNASKLEMVLNPESLGKVTLQLINTKEGLSAQFTVATQEARNLIMKGLDGLKENLLSHGVNVDNVSVKLNDTQESEYNPNWTEQESSGGGNKQQNARQQQKDKKEFEQTMTFIEEENGNV